MPANAPVAAYLRVLGPVELLVGERPVDLGGVRSRALITALALWPGEVVPSERLIALVWGEERPRTVANQLQIAVHRVRTALADSGQDAHRILRREAGGYLLDGVGGDLADFRARRRAGERAAQAGEWGTARSEFEAALGLWHGHCCPDLAASAVVDGIEEERLGVLERRMVADLLAGDPAPVIADAPALLTDQPLRERVSHLLVLAHALSGDRARARAEHERACAAVVDALGIDPGPELRDLDPDGDPAAAVARLRAWIAGPPPAPAVRPRELPAHVRDFVGRPVELAALTTGLEAASTGTGAVLTVVGLGGVGKTALAVHAAHAASRRFPDGCLFADLRGSEPEPRDPHAVLAVFLRSLGVPDDAVPAEPDARAELYRSMLTGRRVLIVCDNAFDADQVRPLLPGTAGSAVLVTARQALTALDPLAGIALDALSQTAAVELLERLSRGAVAHDPERLGELAALTGRLPLALRIVGARVARRGFSLDRIITRLADEQRRLDALSDGDQRVRSCVDIGYRRLSPAAASLLRTAALLPATDIGLWLVTATAGLPADEAAALADELAEAQLIRLHGEDPRVVMHDLVRVFARGEASAGERDGLARGYGALLRLAHEADTALPSRVHFAPGEPPGLPAVDAAVVASARADPRGWFNAEREVLSIACADAAARHGDLAWRLAVVPAAYLEQWFHVDVLRENLAAAASAPGLGPLAGAHLAYGELKVLRSEGRFADCLRLARRLRRDFTRAGDALRAAAVAVEMAKALRQLGRREHVAAAALRWSFDRLPELPPGPLVNAQRGWALMSLAALVIADDVTAAEAHYEHAAEEFRAGGDRTGEARARGSIGAVLQRRGEHRRAIGFFELARDAYAELDVFVDRVYCEVFIASCHHTLGEHEEALHRCEDAIEALRATSHPLMYLGIVHVKGAAQNGLGDFEAARETLTQAAGTARERGMARREASLLGELVASLAGLGDVAGMQIAVDRMRELVSADDPALLRSRRRLAEAGSGAG